VRRCHRSRGSAPLGWNIRFCTKICVILVSADPQMWCAVYFSQGAGLVPVGGVRAKLVGGERYGTKQAFGRVPSWG
jgi:hypothetical protein